MVSALIRGLGTGNMPPFQWRETFNNVKFIFPHHFKMSYILISSFLKRKLETCTGLIHNSIRLILETVMRWQRWTFLSHQNNAHPVQGVNHFCLWRSLNSCFTRWNLIGSFHRSEHCLTIPQLIVPEWFHRSVSALPNSQRCDGIGILCVWPVCWKLKAIHYSFVVLTCLAEWSKLITSKHVHYISVWQKHIWTMWYQWKQNICVSLVLGITFALQLFQSIWDCDVIYLAWHSRDLGKRNEHGYLEWRLWLTN